MNLQKYGYIFSQFCQFCQMEQQPTDPPIQKWKSESFIVKVLLNINLAAVVSGYSLAYFNTITFDDTIKLFQITQDRALMQGLLSFCVALGAGAGGYLAGPLIVKYSRMQGNLITAYMCLVATLLLQTGNIYIIVVCRLLQGIYVGMSSVLRPLYVKQFTPLELAGKTGTFNQILFTFGLIYSFIQTYLLDLFLEPEQYWRVVYFFPVICLLIHIYNIKINYPFETVKYLLQQNRHQEARQLASIIYKEQYVEERIQQLEKIIKLTQNHEDVQMLQMSQIKAPLNGEKNIKGKSNKYAVWAAYHSAMLQQLSGIQIVILYAGDIVLKIWPSIQKTLPILIHSLGFIACYQTIWMLRVYGRKQIIQKGTLVLASISLIFMFCFIWKGMVENTPEQVAFLPSFIVIISFILFRMIFSATLGPVVWLYLPQIVEPDVIAVSTGLNWFVAALISFAFPIVVQKLGGPEFMFGLLGILMFVSYLINEKLLVETKGKSQWEIRQEYNKKFK